MDIFITGNLPKSEKDAGTSVKLQIPVLPENVEVKRATQFTEYDIIGKGPVKVPTGEELNVYSWEAILPGESQKNHPMVRKYTKAETVLTYFNTWKKYKVKLDLRIVGMGIHSKVYLDSVEDKRGGPFGGCVYSIRFVEAKDIIVSMAVESTKKPSTSNTKKDSASKTYTVKSGDTLWGIAVKFYGKGTSNTIIYNKNKDLLDSTARKYGKSSSNNGWWIYPGTVLVIP